MEEFKKLGLSKNTIEVLEKKGFSKPTLIQSKVIPLLLNGKKDVVGQSQTGTGKTAGFALPILETIKEKSRTVQAIILTPTRELALQVSKEIDSLKGNKEVIVLPVYGGTSIGVQREKLKKGVDIVVGTPGRIMDLQRRKSLRLNNISYVVLDEADEMLNMGFVDDIKTILKNTPKDKKMLLFSATMPKQILNIAKTYMREYELIEIEKAQVIINTIEQLYYNINPKDRVEGLRRILDFNSNFHGIIFCNTKRNVDTLVHQLTKLNYRAAALHGDVTQDQREKILKQFRTGHVKVLVATDVAARGIDVEDLTHIINYSLPLSSESYVHRIGRTGRAGKKGVAISFVIPSEKRKLNSIERNNNCKLIQKEFPLPKDIIEKKEEQVKEIIKNIIEANMGKSSKYKAMADGLLKKYHAGEVVSAILKYSFKNELDVNSYNDLGQLRMSSSREGRKKRQRGRRRPRSRDRRSNNEFDNKKTEHKTFSDHQANNKDKKPRNSSFKKKRRRR